MHAHRSARKEAEDSRPGTAGPAPTPPLQALQHSAGNAAVVQLLRRAGHPGAERDPRQPVPAGPVVQRMPLEAFTAQVTQEFTEQAPDAAGQHAGQWSQEGWLSRFRQWFAAREGVAGEELDDHIVGAVAPERLAEELAAFRSEGREFALAASMSELEGTLRHDGPTFPAGTRGIPRGMNARKDFMQWLTGQKDSPQRMNCWEAVLYAACRESLVDKEYVTRAIARAHAEEPPEFAKRILASPAKQLTAQLEETRLVAISATESIPRGYVVIFGDAEHVALSTGETLANRVPFVKERYGEQGHGVYELDNGTNGVEKTTIEDVIGHRNHYGKKLTWGRLPSLAQ